MRRTDRQVNNIGEILDIINNCKVCRIAINDVKAPYIVPLNFGYSYENNKLTLYFHCAKLGKKIDLIKACNNVSFEMDCNHQLVEAAEACKYGYAYASVIGYGSIQFVDNYEQKVAGLNAIMKQHTGKNFEFNIKAVNNIHVLKLVVSDFTAKAKK